MPVERSGSAKPKCHFVTRAGAYFPLLVVFCSVLLVGSLSRCLLVLWQFDRVSESGVFSSIFLHGLRVDLILAGMAVAPMLLVLPILGNRFNWALWKKLTFSWAILVIALIIFMELVTPAFINQYDVRPNLGDGGLTAAGDGQRRGGHRADPGRQSAALHPQLRQLLITAKS